MLDDLSGLRTLYVDADGEGVIGRVIKSYVDEECLTEGELDITKVHPLLWSQGAGDNLYYSLGPPLDHHHKE